MPEFVVPVMEQVTPAIGGQTQTTTMFGATGPGLFKDEEVLLLDIYAAGEDSIQALTAKHCVAASASAVK